MTSNYEIQYLIDLLNYKSGYGSSPGNSFMAADRGVPNRQIGKTTAAIKLAASCDGWYIAANYSMAQYVATEFNYKKVSSIGNLQKLAGDSSPIILDPDTSLYMMNELQNKQQDQLTESKNKELMYKNQIDYLKQIVLECLPEEVALILTHRNPHIRALINDGEDE